MTPRQATICRLSHHITTQLLRKERKMKKQEMIWKVLAVVAILGLLSVPSALAGEMTISGTVEKGDRGIQISTDDGQTYAVQGKDLSEMVGKSVKATGTLAEDADGKIIEVTMVEEIKKIK
jgi:hypothetical protein